MDYAHDPVKAKLLDMLARLTDEQMAQVEEYLKNLIDKKED